MGYYILLTFKKYNFLSFLYFAYNLIYFLLSTNIIAIEIFLYILSRLIFDNDLLSDI